MKVLCVDNRNSDIKLKALYSVYDVLDNYYVIKELGGRSYYKRRFLVINNPLLYAIFGVS